MANQLSNRRVAILATDGFEQAELEQPLEALRQAGASPEVIAPKPGRIQGMEHDEKGRTVAVDRTLDEARPEDYQALVLPGGVANPDKLRIQPAAVAFVRHFVESGKPIAAICHGPWTLIEAGGVDGRTMTSWPSLHSDLANAGAHWVDREVVVDRGLVTSRRPDDLPAFCARMIEAFAEGRHQPARAAE
jgi:protease I